jgi:hypothetical protein
MAISVPGATVATAVIDDPLLGPAHVITTPLGTTTMQALDWDRPTRIPAIANPAVLGRAGGFLLNEIAIRAIDADVTALQYAGPYPTPSLFRALRRSFTTTGTEADFTANLVARMANLSRDPIPIDFAPAPVTYVFHPRGHVELRDRPTRAVVDGIAYETNGSVTRLVAIEGAGSTTSGLFACELWFGDSPYACVATLDSAGSLVGPIEAITPSTSAVIGQPFPPALVAAIAQLVGDASPLPDAACAWVATQSITWADLGARVARTTSTGIELHAALWDHIGPLGLGRLVLAVAEAIAPLATQAVVAQLTAPR